MKSHSTKCAPLIICLLMNPIWLHAVIADKVEVKAAVSVPPLPQGQWTAHGLDAQGREDLNRFLDDSVKNQTVPGGAVMIAHKEEVIFARSFGMADPATGREFQLDTPLRIVNVTQAVMATLAVKMKDFKLLDLDIPIDAWLPEFARLKRTDGSTPLQAPTLRQLLAHTSGLPSSTPPLEGHPSLTDVVRSTARLHLLTDPGKSSVYSDKGYDVAARVMEIAAHTSIDKALNQYLCAPLGMTETTFYPDMTLAHRIAPPVVRLNARFMTAENPDEPIPGLYVPMGTAMVSSAEDLMRLALYHLTEGRWPENNKITSPSLAQMYDEPPGSVGWGMGFKLLGVEKGGHARRMEQYAKSGVKLWIDFDRSIAVVAGAQFPEGLIAPGMDEKGARPFLEDLEKKIDGIFPLPSEGRTTGE